MKSQHQRKSERGGKKHQRKSERDLLRQRKSEREGKTSEKFRESFESQREGAKDARAPTGAWSASRLVGHWGAGWSIVNNRRHCH